MIDDVSVDGSSRAIGLQGRTGSDAVHPTQSPDKGFPNTVCDGLTKLEPLQYAVPPVGAIGLAEK